MRRLTTGRDWAISPSLRLSPETRTHHRLVVNTPASVPLFATLGVAAQQFGELLALAAVTHESDDLSSPTSRPAHDGIQQ